MFPANAHRFDPYRTFKFQVLIDGQPVAGLKKMGALKKKTEPIKWRTAGDPSHERVLPGGTSYEPIVLEQGLTQDPVFEAWANLVNNVEGDAAMSLKNFRKNIVVNVLNMQGQVAISYKIFRAWDPLNGRTASEERGFFGRGSMDGTNRANIKAGLQVLVVLKEDQHSGKLTEGIVKDILTKSPTHPHGIKVRLEGGEIGRVKKII